MQSVLILGAGLLQKPSILAAKRLGYRAAVIDGNEAAVCVPLADEFYHVDLKDREGILHLAQEIMAREGLAAVFTAGTDFSASVSYAAARLGLPCHPFEAALNASDKGRMRACFASSGVPSPAFRIVDKWFDTSPIGGTHQPPKDADAEAAALEAAALEAARSLGFPCVIKPVDNMGARGCRMVRCEAEAAGAVRAAIASSRTGRAIVEEYMDGAEYSIDALVFDGEVTVTGFADRHIYWPPYFIETGHTMPTAADEAKRTALIEAFARGIAALGLTHGAAKADIKWTAKGPMIGEIAARLSGGYMSGWTYPYASGLDLTEAALLVACGKKPDALIKGRVAIPRNDEAAGGGKAADRPFALYDYPCNAVCAERAWVSIPGTVGEVIGLDEAEKTENVRCVFPRAKAGDSADFPRNNVQKCGNAIAAAPTRLAAVEAAESAARSVVLRLAPHNKATDDFLSAEAADAAAANGAAAGEEGFPPWAYGDEAEARAAEALEGDFEADERAADNVPDCLAALYASDVRDYNRRTLKETLVLFDKLCGARRCAVRRSVFYRAVLRGGLQGALYVCDSV